MIKDKVAFWGGFFNMTVGCVLIVASVYSHAVAIGVSCMYSVTVIYSAFHILQNEIDKN